MLAFLFLYEQRSLDGEHECQYSKGGMLHYRQRIIASLSGGELLKIKLRLLFDGKQSPKNWKR
jgi:hypothetical protein